MAFVSDSENVILSIANIPAGSAPTPAWAKVGPLLFEGHFCQRYSGLSEDRAAPNTQGIPGLAPYIVLGDPWTQGSGVILFSLPYSTCSGLLQFLQLQLDSPAESRWAGRVKIKNVLYTQLLRKSDNSVHFKGCLPRSWAVICV